MGHDEMAQPNESTRSRSEIPGSMVPIGAATPEEIGGIIELLNGRPPAYWMRKISDADLRTFVKYALGSPLSVLLVARPNGETTPAGYVFAILDATRFWMGFALRNPAIAQSIFIYRLRRTFERRQEAAQRSNADGGTADAPAFEWSPSHPSSARIIGLYVRKEHRRKGIAMDLYFTLFQALQGKGVVRVEEYMGPDYMQYAGKFPDTCGWQLQKCRCEGYKISKSL